MNKVALRYMLDNKGVEYQEKDTGICVYSRVLDNELLGEINACNGAITTFESEAYFIRPEEEVDMS